MLEEGAREHITAAHLQMPQNNNNRKKTRMHHKVKIGSGHCFQFAGRFSYSILLGFVVFWGRVLREQTPRTI